MKPFVRSLIRLSFVLCILFVASAALAQTSAPPATWSAAWLQIVLLPLVFKYGTLASGILAVVSAQFPTWTWASKLGSIIGSLLPILDIHGLTTGTMQRRMTAAVEAAKLSKAVAVNAAS